MACKYPSTELYSSAAMTPNMNLTVTGVGVGASTEGKSYLTAAGSGGVGSAGGVEFFTGVGTTTESSLSAFMSHGVSCCKSSSTTAGGVGSVGAGDDSTGSGAGAGIDKVRQGIVRTSHDETDKMGKAINRTVEKACHHWYRH